MRAAVIGGGVIGTSCAVGLAERGLRTTLFDPRPAGHNQGSSHGRSRIIRRAYPDVFYTNIMTEAYPMWAELEAFSNETLVNECGVVYIGRETSHMLRDVEKAVTKLGVDFRDFDPETQDGPRLSSTERGLFVPEGGWVHADWAVGALRAKLDSLGGEVVAATVADVAELNDYDRVVIAAGPWIGKFLDLPIKVCVQTYAYAECTRPIRGPVWIHDTPELFYGFPSEPDSNRIKIGVHRAGRRVDPDDDARVPSPKDVEAIRKEAEERFETIPDSIEAHACLYTIREGDDFLMGQVDERVSFISACSGHAFKLAPWLGRLMAKFAVSDDKPENWPRFHYIPKPRQ